MNNDATIHVVMKSQEGILLDGNYTALSSYNEVGLFDVLPMHTNFISLIRNKVFLHDKDQIKEMPIGMGILKVVDNQITIYLGFTEIELNKPEQADTKQQEHKPKRKPFVERFIHAPEPKATS